MKSIILVLLTVSTITSCKKEGCTDPDAYNFNEKAKKDDGSCIYESNTTFWFKKAVSDSLISYGASNLVIKLGEVSTYQPQIGIETYNFLINEPNCGDDYSQSTTIGTFLSENEKKYEYIEVICYPSADGGVPFTIVEESYLHVLGCNSYEIKF